MDPKEKRLFVVFGAIVVLVISVLAIYMGKSSEVEEFKKQQKGKHGRISAIRNSMKDGGAKDKKKGGKEAAPAAKGQ